MNGILPLLMSKKLKYTKSNTKENKMKTEKFVITGSIGFTAAAAKKTDPEFKEILRIQLMELRSDLLKTRQDWLFKPS